MEEKEKIEIRTQDIEAILGKSPAWLVRWGTTVMAAVLFVLLGVAAFFSYPDLVSAPLTITPEQPPFRVVAPEAMVVRRVLASENARVEASDSLLSGITVAGKTVWIQSPADGRILFSAVLLPGLSLKAGEPILSVVPPSSGKYVGIIRVPGSNLARLSVGQVAQIRLDEYPYMQYGVLKGKVAFIARLPVDGAYQVLIDLPSESMSSHGKPIVLHPEMSGTVNIITRNVSLLQRLLGSVLNR